MAADPETSGSETGRERVKRDPLPASPAAGALTPMVAPPTGAEGDLVLERDAVELKANGRQADAALVRSQDLFEEGFIGQAALDEVLEARELANAQMRPTTVLFVTHNADLASRCDKTIEAIDGRLTG